MAPSKSAEPQEPTAPQEAWEAAVAMMSRAPTMADVRQGLSVAVWRALGAAATGDAAKAPAAALGALEALERGRALDAEADAPVGPVTLDEVVAAGQRAVRASLAGDPKAAAAWASAVAVWRAERALLDPDGAAAGAAEDDEALLAEVAAAEARALEHAQAWAAAAAEEVRDGTDG